MVLNKILANFGENHIKILANFGENHIKILANFGEFQKTFLYFWLC